MKTQKTMKTANIGSISHGTLRTEDLLSAFASELESLILVNGDYFSLPENHTQRNTLNELVGEAQDSWNEDGETLQDEDRASELVQELSEALEQFAPPYCTFTYANGDPSDLGFFPNWDEIDELPHVNDSDEAKALGEDCKFANDHGNVTVYGGDGSILLEIV